MNCSEHALVLRRDSASNNHTFESMVNFLVAFIVSPLRQTKNIKVKLCGWQPASRVWIVNLQITHRSLARVFVQTIVCRFSPKTKRAPVFNLLNQTSPNSNPVNQKSTSHSGISARRIKNIAATMTSKLHSFFHTFYSHSYHPVLYKNVQKLLTPPPQSHIYRRLDELIRSIQNSLECLQCNDWILPG